MGPVLFSKTDLKNFFLAFILLFFVLLGSGQPLERKFYVIVFKREEIENSL